MKCKVHSNPHKSTPASVWLRRISRLRGIPRLRGVPRLLWGIPRLLRGIPRLLRGVCWLWRVTRRGVALRGCRWLWRVTRWWLCSHWVDRSWWWLSPNRIGRSWCSSGSNDNYFLSAWFLVMYDHWFLVMYDYRFPGWRHLLGHHHHSLSRWDMAPVSMVMRVVMVRHVVCYVGSMPSMCSLVMCGGCLGLQMNGSSDVSMQSCIHRLVVKAIFLPVQSGLLLQCPSLFSCPATSHYPVNSDSYQQTVLLV